MFAILRDSSTDQKEVAIVRYRSVVQRGFTATIWKLKRQLLLLLEYKTTEVSICETAQKKKNDEPQQNSKFKNYCRFIFSFDNYDFGRAFGKHITI